MRAKNGNSGGSGHGGGRASQNGGNFDKQWYADRGITYLQDPSNWDRSQLDAYFAATKDKPDTQSGPMWNWHKSALARDNELKAQEAEQERWAQWSESLAGMTEALKQVADTSAYVTPHTEVLKQAPAATNEARDETARLQALRRGLLSTFTTLGGTSKLGGTDF